MVTRNASISFLFFLGKDDYSIVSMVDWSRRARSQLSHGPVSTQGVFGGTSNL